MPISNVKIVEELGLEPTASCGWCGRPMFPLRSTAQYCGDGCRQRAHRARRRGLAPPNAIREPVRTAGPDEERLKPAAAKLAARLRWEEEQRRMIERANEVFRRARLGERGEGEEHA